MMCHVKRCKAMLWNSEWMVFLINWKSESGVVAARIQRKRIVNAYANT